MTMFQLGYMLEKRRGGNQDRLVLKYPTPESQYPYFQPEPGNYHRCEDTCDKQYCLTDVCLTQFMADCYFPASRPVAVPVSYADLNLEYKPRYVLICFRVRA